MDHDLSGRLHPRRRDHAYHPLRLITAALEAERAHGLEGPVVDLGCGSRPYAALLPTPYFGLDAHHQHGAPDVAAWAEAVPMRAGFAGTVLSTQQLEHVDDPARVIAEAHRVLRPGGRLLLSTHGVWAHHPDPSDLWRWTEEGLTRLVSEGGFAVERCHRLGGPVLAGALLATYPVSGAARNRRGAVRSASRGALAAMNWIVWPLDQLVERRAPRHYGSVGYVVSAVAA